MVLFNSKDGIPEGFPSFFASNIVV